jgi:hypothetical protein
MPIDPKIRMVSVLLLPLMFAPWRDASSADVRKPLVTPSQEQEKVVIARREPRLVSRQEIFQAIQNDLARLGITGRERLQLDDLLIQSSVPALKPDVGLQVKRIGFDPLRRVTVFELWASQEPQYLPFKVTTRCDPQSWGFRSEWRQEGVESGLWAESSSTFGGAGKSTSKLPVLAKPGRFATLVMLGQNIRITTTVLPLQPGSKGQRILVRDPDTQRVMSAEVVDEGLLQAGF